MQQLGPSDLYNMQQLVTSALYDTQQLGTSALNYMQQLGPSALYCIQKLGPCALYYMQHLGPSSLYVLHALIRPLQSMCTACNRQAPPLQLGVTVLHAKLGLMPLHATVRHLHSTLNACIAALHCIHSTVPTACNTNSQGSRLKRRLALLCTTVLHSLQQLDLKVLHAKARPHIACNRQSSLLYCQVFEFYVACNSHASPQHAPTVLQASQFRTALRPCNSICMYAACSSITSQHGTVWV